MPPNLGGFFMVRSYYPSECHADYFDFERIEALKPAIEACGRSEERFSRNAETDLVCRLLLEKKKKNKKKQRRSNKKQHSLMHRVQRKQEMRIISQILKRIES